MSQQDNVNWLADLRSDYKSKQRQQITNTTSNHVDNQNDNEIIYRVSIAILTKIKNEIHGHECRVSKMTATLQMDFLGNKVTPIIFEKIVRVNPEQCRSMKA